MQAQENDLCSVDIILRMRNLKEIIMAYKIVLDAGHGGQDIRVLFIKIVRKRMTI